jgi:glycosyltransferase involved in cell wall biosynthesis
LEMDLSVCLVATEIFGWGRYGGFGSCTRMIGSALAGRGVNVSVVVPLGDGQRPLEELDGVTVHGFPLHRYPSTGQVYRGIDADVYHSEEPSWGTRAALGAVPGRIHIATCQNPRTREDWRLVEGFYPMRRRFFNALFTGELKRAVRQLDAVYCQALYTIRKVREMYDLPYEPGFLPNPVEVPKARASKAEDPTVCFLGRLDGEKRPQLFFELARRFPDIRFVAMGRAHDGGRDRLLRERYSGISNLELVGFKTGPEKLEVLNKSWVLVNTSVSECLPVSFLEAAAHGCAILSFHDPDGFASRFGHHVRDGDLESGLRALLGGDSWRERGEAGRAYVSEVHEVGAVTDMHIEAYRALLA